MLLALWLTPIIVYAKLETLLLFREELRLHRYSLYID